MWLGLVKEVILIFSFIFFLSSTERSIPHYTENLDPQSTNVRQPDVSYCLGISFVLEVTLNFQPRITNVLSNPNY